MKNENNLLETVLENLENSNLEYISVLVEQISDNEDKINRLATESEDFSSLAMLKYEVLRLTSRNESFTNLLLNLISESHKAKEENISLLFKAMKENVEG